MTNIDINVDAHKRLVSIDSIQGNSIQADKGALQKKEKELQRLFERPSALSTKGADNWDKTFG